MARPDHQTAQPMGAGSSTRRPESAAALSLESTLADNVGDYNRCTSVTLITPTLTIPGEAKKK